MMTNDSLIDHLSDYFSNEDVKGFEVLDFVGAFGSPLMAVAYSKLFWPDFEVFKEMVFLKEELSEEKRVKIENLLNEGWTTDRVEKSFKLFEVPSYLFGKNLGDTYDEENEYLAEVLSQMWSAKLGQDFPDRNFEVEVLRADETESEIAIRFFQV